MSARRTVVIGDVHGCIDELDELLGVVGRTHRDARLVFLGDLVDRGPDSAAVVRRVRGLDAACVQGNHDEKHVRWARHEARRAADPTYVNPMKMSAERRAEHAAIGADGIAYLARLPIKLSLGNGWWAVHGGCAPKQPFAKQKPATLIRCRWVDEAGAMLGVVDPPPGAHHWAARWPGPESIVYGHHVHGLAEPRRDAYEEATCWGLDTGCCFGGRLTALVVETGEVIQVAARRKYAELREANQEA